MVFALIQTGSVSPSKWTTYLPCRDLYAQSKQRRVRRWLGNSRLNIHRLYKPLIQAALSTWEAESLYLCLDTSLFWEQYCLIRLAVVYRGRSIPLAWRVLEHNRAAVAFEAYEELLRQSAQYLPTKVNVILLADRGFVHTRAMKLMQQLGWHYRIRIKSDTRLWRAGSGWCQPTSFHLGRGKALCFHHVRLHRQQKYGPVHVILGRNNYGLFSQWRRSTSPLKGWTLCKQAVGDGLIPIGPGATAIFASGLSGQKRLCSTAGN